MYAAPQIPVVETNIKPLPADIYVPAISKYAAPQIPVIEVNPVPFPGQVISMYAAVQPIVEPGIVKPPVLRYAAPNIPPVEMNIPVNKIELQKNMPKDNPALNESSLNINNIKPTNMPANINTATSINDANGIINAQSFIYTDYGHVRIIEPYSHIIFK